MPSLCLQFQRTSDLVVTINVSKLYGMLVRCIKGKLNCLPKNGANVAQLLFTRVICFILTS